MGFEKFGKFHYISQAKVAPLVSYLEKGQLSTTQCKNCGRAFFPPRADCPDCRERGDIEWIPIDGTGKLVTFTEVHFAPPAFQPETPYLLGVAELADGLRVFAPISRKIRRDELKPGLRLVLTPNHSGDRVSYELRK